MASSIDSTCFESFSGHSQNDRTLHTDFQACVVVLWDVLNSFIKGDQLPLAPVRQSDESLSLTVWFGILLVGDVVLR